MQTTSDFLATVALFQGLDNAELTRLAELTRERTYPKGSVILFEDDPGDSLFIVKGGRVKVVLVGEDGREVEESPALAWALLLALSRRLRRADEQIGGLVLLDVHGRIGRLILDSAGEDGVLDKKLTHQTIAHMIGASRETVSRAMREFQDRGLVTVNRRQIAIADRAGLEQIAHRRA
jgi:CRP-like cAMP-binding protein